MSRYATDTDRAEFVSALADAESASELGDTEASDAPEPDDAPDEGDDPGEVGDQPSESGDDAPDESSDDDAPAAAEATFPVTINGRTVDVPLSELAEGYVRRSDYTRKTQLLAAERRDLADANALLQALNTNPAQTLNILAHHYGLGDGDLTSEDAQPPSPVEVQMRELKAWQEQQDARQREAMVDAELARLHSRYGDFDEEELFTFALQRGVGHLETALRALTFDHVAKPTNGRQVEKRKVAGQARTNGHNGAAAPKQPAEQITKFSDAYAAAKRELDNGRT